MPSFCHNVENLGARGSVKPWHVARGPRIKEKEEEDTLCVGQWCCRWRVGGALGKNKGRKGDGQSSVQQKEEQMR